ncbi:MAG: hypothetical protein P5676_20250, partial [Limnospira sp. PMC 1252.20]|nr:hypothetical protein [Limnospira sp. PMC 1252.20]
LRFTQPTTRFLYPPREKPTLRNGERSPNLYTRICWVSLRFTQPTTRNRVSLPPTIPEFVGCRFALPNLRLGFLTPPGRNWVSLPPGISH